MGDDNCSTEGGPPSTASFIKELKVAEYVVMGICCLLCLVNVFLSGETMLYIWRKHRQLKRAVRASAWLLGLQPTLAIISLMSMFIPRIFIFRDVLCFITLSIAMDKFVRLVGAYYRSFERVRKTVQAERKLRFNVGPCLCCCPCLPSIDITKTNVRKVRWIVLQYPIITVISSIILMVTWLNGNYDPGKWKADNPYSYIQAVRILTTIVAFHGLNILVMPCLAHMRCFYMVPKYISLKLCLVFFGLQGLIFDLINSNTSLFEFRDCVDKKVMAAFCEDIAFVIEMSLLTHFNRWAYRREMREPSEVNKHGGALADAEANTSSMKTEVNEAFEKEMEKELEMDDVPVLAVENGVCQNQPKSMNSDKSPYINNVNNNAAYDESGTLQCSL